MNRRRLAAAVRAMDRAVRDLNCRLSQTKPPPARVVRFGQALAMTDAQLERIRDPLNLEKR